MRFRFAIRRFSWIMLWCGAVLSVGCGTTRSTDTSRTATEQLLLSDSIDRTVQQLNFRPIAGRSVYLDETYLTGTTDRSYLVSTLRQHMLASGCILSTSRDKAEYIVEARAGAVGTNRHQLLFGIPSINVPSFLPISAGVPTSIPEVPIVKRSDARGVTKIAVFAYHRETGAPIWQSGIAMDRSTARDTWVLGAGPFQSGTIREGTVFAGAKIKNPLNFDSDTRSSSPVVAVREEAVFESHTPPMLAEAEAEKPDQPVKK